MKPIKFLINGISKSTQPFKICTQHKSSFRKWKYLMAAQDFNIVLYGLGSKRDLLNEFHHDMLEKNDAIVVNGYFPSLSIKQILSTILNDILELKNNIGTSLSEQADCILKAYNSQLDHLYLMMIWITNVPSMIQRWLSEWKNWKEKN